MHKYKKLLLKPGLFEQAMIALLNFLIILIFSKTLVPSQFAQFIIIHSSISLIFLISSSMWGNPILVFLPTRFNESTSSYVKFLTYNNILFSILFSILCLFLVDSYIRHLTLTEIILSSLIVTVWCQYELLRKVHYSLNLVRDVLLSTLFLVIFFTICCIAFYQKMNVNISLLILLFSYLFSILKLVIKTKGKKPLDLYINKTKINKIKVFKIHWEYAKWTILGGLLFWLGTQGYILYLTKFISDTQLGGLRVAINLLGVLSILLVYFENTHTPITSQIYFKKGVNELSLYLKKVAKKSSGPFIVVIIFASLFAYFSFTIVFGDTYSHYRNLTLIFGINQLIQGLNRPAIVGLRALNRTRHFFYGNLILVLSTFSIGTILAKEYLNFGAALSMMISSLFVTIYFIFAFKKEINLGLK